VSDILEISEGDLLIKQGDESSCLYFLQKGVLGVYLDLEGTEKVVGQIQSGEVVGEMSFLDSQKRSATIKAVSRCTLQVIPSDSFNKFFKKQPSWHQLMIKNIAKRITEANAKVCKG
jgi:CRP/FNR family transcriptional regulator, cyclic AMP receptor protein